MRAVAEEVLELVLELRRRELHRARRRPRRAASSTERMFGAELYEAMREVKRLFDPDGRLNPGKIVDAPPMTEHLRDPALPPRRAAAHPPALRRRRRDARRGRPLHEHRRLPQDRRRHDVPVLHGHARGAARHPRAGERAGEGAVAARPARRARRRAPARDPRPLPGVQGVQERVPAERRHGVAEERVPRALPRDPRHAAALAGVREHPARSTGSARRPRRCRTCRRACRLRGRCSSAARHRRASGRCRASSARR